MKKILFTMAVLTLITTGCSKKENITKPEEEIDLTQNVFSTDEDFKNYKRNVKNLSEKELVLFNRRFLELMFPDIIKRRPGFSMFICTNGTNYSKEILRLFDDLKMDTICISLDGPSGVMCRVRCR